MVFALFTSGCMQTG